MITMGLTGMLFLSAVHARGGTAEEADAVLRIMGPETPKMMPSDIASRIDEVLAQVRTDD